MPPAHPPTPLRVLTFLHSHEPGGVERIALRLVRHWRADGREAPLFLGRADGAMATDVGAGLEAVMPRGRWPGIAHWETPWMIATLPRVIRSLRPDLLFCAGNSYAVVAVAMKLILGRNCPPIVAKISNDLDRRDTPGWQRWFYRRWLRLQGRFIDHFTGMETPMLAEIAEATGVSADRITIIPDPALSEALIDRLRALPEPARTGPGRRFVAIGRLAAQKNIALMLDAFARGGTPDDRLTLIGDGPDRAALEARAKRLGIAARVDFLGYRPDPAQLLPAHDVLLLSSDFEGVPAVVLEALAARRAIVATRCSRSMGALLQDGALGTLVPVGDVRALADAIAAARPGDQDDAASLAQARRFTIEAAAGRYWATFAQVARTTEGAVA